MKKIVALSMLFSALLTFLRDSVSIGSDYNPDRGAGTLSSSRRTMVSEFTFSDSA